MSSSPNRIKPVTTQHEGKGQGLHYSWGATDTDGSEGKKPALQPCGPGRLTTLQELQIQAAGQPQRDWRVTEQTAQRGHAAETQVVTNGACQLNSHKRNNLGSHYTRRKSALKMPQVSMQNTQLREKSGEIQICTTKGIILERISWTSLRLQTSPVKNIVKRMTKTNGAKCLPKGLWWQKRTVV